MKHKYEFSKILAFTSLVIFITTLVVCMISMLVAMFSGTCNVFDLGVFTVAITVTGSLAGMTFKFYFQKSGLQNTTHIKRGFYAECMKIRLQYIEKTLQLQKKYGVNQETINQIDYDSPFRELSDSAMNQVVCRMDDVDAQNMQDVNYEQM